VQNVEETRWFRALEPREVQNGGGLLKIGTAPWESGKEAVERTETSLRGETRMVEPSGVVASRGWGKEVLCTEWKVG